jgi:hypothetical protein
VRPLSSRGSAARAARSSCARPAPPSEPRLVPVDAVDEDGAVERVRALVVATDEGVERAELAHASQPLLEEGSGKASASVFRDGRAGLDQGAPRDVVEPEGGEGRDAPVGGDRDEVEIASVERGALDAHVPGRVGPVLERDPDVAIVERESGGVGALEQFEPVAHGAQGVPGSGRRAVHRAPQVAAPLALGALDRRIPALSQHLRAEPVVLEAPDRQGPSAVGRGYGMLLLGREQHRALERVARLAGIGAEMRLARPAIAEDEAEERTFLLPEESHLLERAPRHVREPVPAGVLEPGDVPGAWPAACQVEGLAEERAGAPQVVGEEGSRLEHRRGSSALWGGCAAVAALGLHHLLMNVPDLAPQCREVNVVIRGTDVRAWRAA